METLLNEKEAAAFFGVGADELTNMVAHKVIPAYMIGGKFLRFKQEELQAIKYMLEENADSQDERIFTQAFREVKGVERFKEILRANDIYLIVICVIILGSIFILFK